MHSLKNFSSTLQAWLHKICLKWNLGQFHLKYTQAHVCVDLSLQAQIVELKVWPFRVQLKLSLLNTYLHRILVFIAYLSLLHPCVEHVTTVVPKSSSWPGQGCYGWPGTRGWPKQVVRWSGKRKLLSRIVFAVMNSICCHGLALLSWTACVVKNCICYHEQSLLSWTASAVMNCLYCYELPLMSWTAFAIMNWLCCHELALLSWTVFNVMNSCCCHELPLLSWIGFAVMNWPRCDELSIVSWTVVAVMN